MALPGQRRSGGPPAWRCRWRLLLVWLLLGWAGAAQAWPEDCQPPGHLSLAEQVLELEREGRARPAACAAQLGRLAASGTLTPAGRVEALMLQGALHARLADRGGVEAVVGQLEHAATQLPLAGAAVPWVRARLADQGGDTAQANLLADQALAQLPADAGPLQRLRFLSLQGQLRNAASRLQEAIAIDLQALRLADALGVAWRQSEVRGDLAYSYFQAHQNDQALRLSHESLAYAQRADDAITLAHAYTVHGIVLDGAGDKDGEREAMRAALEHARRAGAKYEEALYLANLADYHLKSGQYEQALRHAQAALPLTRELKNLGGETVALANIGLAQIALGDVESGKRHLRESIAIDERRGSLTGVSDSYAEMAQYLERAGDARGAIEAWHSHRALAGQILARDQQQAILELQEQAAAEQRRHDLVLLQRERQIQGEALRARTLQQRLGWLAAACGALAVGVVLLGVRRVRQVNHQLQQSNARLEQQALVDPLTGLANRRQLQETMRRRGPSEGFAGTLFLADLDHFKRINDRHGHAAGDAVLVQVAQRLQALLREADLVVRWGGEEFLVIVRSAAPDAVQAMAQRMLDAVAATPVVHEGRSIPVTLSIGYATFPLEPTRLSVGWERAIGLVDTAMYLAKAHGRNRAYGVRRLQARTDPQFEAVSRALESAWMAGEVTLAALRGPPPAGAAAPADLTEATA